MRDLRPSTQIIAALAVIVYIALATWGVVFLSEGDFVGGVLIALAIWGGWGLSQWLRWERRRAPGD